MATPTVAALTATTPDFIRLASTLPPRLLRFFARFPPGTHNPVRLNPFKPTVHPATGRWHNPIFSMRRQAEICKLSRQYGVEELLPPSRKSSLWKKEREMVRAEKGGVWAAKGRKVKEGEEGGGLGGLVKMRRMVEPKGKGWERGLHAKLEKRRKAMEGMPALIEKWKRTGHGRGWKDWPKA